MGVYQSGNANSFLDLKGVVESVLLGAGWVESNGVYRKEGMHVQLSIVGAAGGRGLEVNAGTDQAGSALLGAAPHAVRIHEWTSRDPIVWPITYHIHVGEAPDEVYVVVVYNSTRVQCLGFGRSPAPGNPTGYWISGAGGPQSNFGSENTNYQWDDNHPAPRAAMNNNTISVAAGVLASRRGAAHLSVAPYWCHSESGWNTPALEDQNDSLSGNYYANELLRALPSGMNQGMVLVPAYVFELATDFRVLPLLQVGHMRHCRVDNYGLGDVVSFGADRWKVYPMGRRNSSVRNPQGGVDHTGTFGFALRYFGP